LTGGKERVRQLEYRAMKKMQRAAEEMQEQHKQQEARIEDNNLKLRGSIQLDAVT
jgi:DNA-binding protein YbaB